MSTQFQVNVSIPSQSRNHSAMLSTDSIDLSDNLHDLKNMDKKLLNSIDENSEEPEPTELKANNSAYDLVQNQKYHKFDETINSSILSINSTIFHPDKFLNNSKFKAPSSTISTAATIDPLDKLNNNMDELNNYDKEQTLGNGTDAFVYEIVDRKSKSHFAMKLTKRKSGRYRTEIHLLYQLRDSENIVKLLKVLENDCVYVLILEQAPMTLEILLQERCTEIAMQEKIACTIIYDTLNGLKSISNLGFVHKDIKPENILIFANREKKKLQAKIADFGFATRCALGNNKIALTKEKVNEFESKVKDKCGTPGFWAPELVAGVIELKHAFKLDIFSTGVTLYRMLCNEMPFGLFETWNVKKDTKKLAKLKPNFHVVKWVRVVGNDKKKVQYIRKLADLNLSDNAKNLLICMLKSRPETRFDIGQCMNHEWFKKF